MEQTTTVSAPPAARIQMQEQGLLNIRALPALLSIITLALGLFYLAVIPPWGGPDEPRHYEYVRLLYEKGRLIGYPDIDKNVMNEVIRSMDAVNYWAWGVTLWHRTKPGELPKDFTAIYGEAAHQLHQPPLAYLLYLIPLRAFINSSIQTQLYAMRLLSILLNIVTVLAAYVAGREIFRTKDNPDPTMALAIPVFVMLLPQHLFLHSTVMNDHLVEAAMAWIIALIARTFRLGLSLPRVIAMFLLFIVAVGAKRSGLYAVPIIGFAFLVYMFLHWGKGRLTMTQRSIRFAGVIIFLSLLAVGLFAAWNWITVHIPKLSEYIVVLFLFLPSEQFPFSLNDTLFRPDSLHLFAAYFKRIFISTWGHFGWMNITLGVQAYWGFAALCVAAAVGLVVYLVRDFRKLLSHQRAILVVFAASIVFVFAILIGLEVRNWSLGWEAGAQGRYLFPVLIPFATLFLLGTRAFVPRSRYLLWFTVFTVAMIVYNIVVLGFFIIPFYRG